MRSLSLSNWKKKRKEKRSRDNRKGKQQNRWLIGENMDEAKKKKKTAVKKVIDNARIFSLFLHFYKYK